MLLRYPSSREIGRSEAGIQHSALELRSSASLLPLIPHALPVIIQRARLGFNGGVRNPDALEMRGCRFAKPLAERFRLARGHNHEQQSALVHAEDELARPRVEQDCVPIAQHGRGWRKCGLHGDIKPAQQFLRAAERNH